MVRRRTMFAALAATAAAAVIVTVAAVWPGLDAQQTPPVDTGVWALQTADGRRYARVNTGLGELDTVRGVSNPSSVVQSSDGVFLFSESFGKVTRIDEAMPLDLDEEATRSSQRTPAGTVEVAVAGAFVRAAFLRANLPSSTLIPPTKMRRITPPRRSRSTPVASSTATRRSRRRCSATASPPRRSSPTT